MPRHYTRSGEDRTCAGCGGLFYASPATIRRGWGKYCSPPCAHAHKTGPAMRPLEDRFWEKVEKAEGCWLWIGPTQYGYGFLSAGRKADGNVRAHRLSWTIHNGTIPDGLNVCHDCDRNYPKGDITYRRCVRPDHLFLGTSLDNSRDMVAKGRCNPPTDPTKHLRGETHGRAILTEEQAIHILDTFTGKRGELAAMGRTYGVDPSAIRLLVTGKNWRHLHLATPTRC